MASELRWFKGNTHTHTTNSDGDAPPDVVVAWYERHGYDFLALSDHNLLTPPRVSQPTPVTLLPAEELTLALNIHVNGLGLKKVIPPPVAPYDIPMSAQKHWFLEQAIAAVEAQGGLAHVNHPNFRWALSAEVLETVPSLRFMEVFNGHHLSINGGDAHHPSVESMWDHLLGRGQLVYGLATDDAHHYSTFDPLHANPGRGWIWVRAAGTQPEQILAAIDQGQFYASSGVRLAAYRVCADELVVAVQGAPARLELIGAGGRTLERSDAQEVHFPRPKQDPYVRVRATAADGTRAWMQPVFAA
ncbi:MAG: PHP domain-containing protein [Chloroflexota bacterium]